MRYEVEQGNILMYSPYLWRVVLASESGERKTVAMCENREHAEMLAERLNLDESLKNEYPGKIQFTPMPEVATLRDQFAMAALIADAIQSAVVSSAYIGRGKIMNGNFPGPAAGAKEYYATADALMEARK